VITVNKSTAFDWLWGTTIINLGLGALLWVANYFALANDDFDYSSDAANAVAWQAIGASLWGFGVLVFIITLATSAIVGAIEGDAPKTKSARPSTKKTKTSLGKWLDEDNK
jgi:hypothetical protein